MLNKLNLSNNKIKSVTNTVAKMEYLWELDIGNNEFQTFQRLPSTIRKWYERYNLSNSIDMISKISHERHHSKNFITRSGGARDMSIKVLRPFSRQIS